MDAKASRGMQENPSKTSRASPPPNSHVHHAATTDTKASKASWSVHMTKNPSIMTSPAKYLAFQAHKERHGSWVVDVDEMQIHRRWLAKILYSPFWDMFLSLFIMASLVMVMEETNAIAKDTPTPVEVNVGNNLVLGVFGLDLVFRLLLRQWEFFHSWINITDLVVFVSDVTIQLVALFLRESEEGKQMRSLLRFARLIRLARIVRIVQVMVLLPELHTMIKSLVGAMRAIFCGALVLFIIVTIWAILAVQLVHPLMLELAAAGAFEGCERCPRAFESVSAAILTFTQQIVAGDSWGLICVPMAEAHVWTYFFFLGSLITIDMGILNLILAVICDAAAEARKTNDHDMAIMREAEFENAKTKLLKLFKSIDVDDNGKLTLQELKDAFETNPLFQDAMSAMDVHSEDVEVVFQILDMDNSGDILYEEFINRLHKMKTVDSHTLLVFLNSKVDDMHRKLSLDVLQHLEGLRTAATDMGSSTTAAEETQVLHERNVDLTQAVHELLVKLEERANSCCAAVANMRHETSHPIESGISGWSFPILDSHWVSPPAEASRCEGKRDADWGRELDDCAPISAWRAQKPLSKNLVRDAVDGASEGRLRSRSSSLQTRRKDPVIPDNPATSTNIHSERYGVGPEIPPSPKTRG